MSKCRDIPSLCIPGTDVKVVGTHKNYLTMWYIGDVIAL